MEKKALLERNDISTCAILSYAGKGRSCMMPGLHRKSFAPSSCNFRHGHIADCQRVVDEEADPTLSICSDEDLWSLLQKSYQEFLQLQSLRAMSAHEASPFNAEMTNTFDR